MDPGAPHKSFQTRWVSLSLSLYISLSFYLYISLSIYICMYPLPYQCTYMPTQTLPDSHDQPPTCAPHGGTHVEQTSVSDSTMQQLCELCTSHLLWPGGPSISNHDGPTRAKADATHLVTPRGQQIANPEALTLSFNTDGVGYLVEGSTALAWVTKVFHCNIKVDSSGHKWACREGAEPVTLDEYLRQWRRL